jgi:hypothetical protein
MARAPKCSPEQSLGRYFAFWLSVPFLNRTRLPKIFLNPQQCFSRTPNFAKVFLIKKQFNTS